MRPFSYSSSYSRRAFTLVELLITLGVIAIVSSVTVLAINPAEKLREARDTNRLSDMATLNQALGMAVLEGAVLGNATSVYVSVPDPAIGTDGFWSSCGGMGFATSALPAGYSYSCGSLTRYKNSDGSGWIPVNLKTLPGGSPISVMPVDPANRTSTSLFYAYATDGKNYDLTACMESKKYNTSGQIDGGLYYDAVEKGSNMTVMPADLCGKHGVWVADSSGGHIELFSTTGNIILATGTFNNPQGLAVDSNANVYVGDSGNHRIQVYDVNGKFVKQWTNAQMTPRGLAIDNSSNLYVADSNSSQIWKYDLNGNLLAQWGSYGTGDNQFATPLGVATDQSGYVYVADYNNNRILKFDSSTPPNFVTKWNLPLYIWPIGVTTDLAGNVYVADSSGFRILKYSSSGTQLAQWGGVSGSGPGQFENLNYLSADKNGYIYSTEGAQNYRVQKFDLSGTFIAKWGASGTLPGQFMVPSGPSGIVAF